MFMKRRHFLASGAAGAMGMGTAGCSTLGLGKIDVKQEQTPIELDKKVSKPKGTMPYGTIGKTGIKVSKFGFGSHMRNDLIPYEKERQWMVRKRMILVSTCLIYMIMKDGISSMNLWDGILRR